MSNINYFSVNYHIRELTKLVTKSYENGDIDEGDAVEQLVKLESIAYDAFPLLEPDGDVTYAIAIEIEKIQNG